MHNCPECGSACYCGGDIDDIDVGDQEAEDDCTHCLDGDGDNDEDLNAIDEWDPEGIE